MWETLNTVGNVLLNNQALFLKARKECKECKECKKLFSFKYNSFPYYPFYFTYFSVRELSRGYTPLKAES